MQPIMMLQPGQIVRIHSLKSKAGQKLNDKRGVVIGLATTTDVGEEQRYEVKVERGRPGATSCIKPTNLLVEAALPLPTGNHRGAVYDIGDGMTRDLAELLVRDTPEYSPPETMLTGYPAMAFNRLGEENFIAFTCVQMEQVAGIAALANLCDQGGEAACEDVLFALLEGDSMYLDVLVLLLAATPFIGPEEEFETIVATFEACGETGLTPDQDSHAYIFAMSAGPLMILDEMTKCHFGTALFGALQTNQFYHLLVQRLIRITAREKGKTRDGLKLGPSCRRILPHLCKGHVTADVELTLKAGPVPDQIASSLLAKSSTLVSPESVPALIGDLFSE